MNYEWSMAMRDEYWERSEELMAFIITGFGAGLGGEEKVPLLVSLRGLLHFWDGTKLDPDPFIMVTLCGHFKGETCYLWQGLPICDYTQSVIPFWKWIGHPLHRRKNIEYTGQGVGMALPEGDPTS